MNKVELEAKIMEETGLDKKSVSSVVSSFLNTITENLQNGETVRLVNFGTFQVSERKERNGVNPTTGEKIVIPAQNKPSFKAGKALKEAVNK
jgi:DNA-binding protein HU-beta